MKKIVLNLLILAISCIATNTYSQVGIGTTDPKESLDIAGNIKTTTFSTTWKSMTNGGSYYTIDYIVIYNGVFYKNLTGTNTDTTPNMDAVNWVQSFNTNLAAQFGYYQMTSRTTVGAMSLTTQTSNMGLVSNDRVLLKAGVTYSLECDMDYRATYAGFSIKTVGGTVIGRGFANSANGSDGGNGYAASGIYTPSVDEYVQVRLDYINTATGIFGNSSYFKIIAIANYLPVTTPTLPEPEYLHAKVSANENVQDNQNIDNLTILASAGNVGTAAFSAGTGVVTLTAGRTYKLTASLNATDVTGMDYVTYSWYNITANSPIGNLGVFYPVNATTNISSQPTAIAFIKPSVTTTIDLRIIGLGGVTQATIDADYGYITVEAL